MSEQVRKHHALLPFLANRLNQTARESTVQVKVCPTFEYINLRGDSDDPRLGDAVNDVLSQPLPVVANTFCGGVRRVFWLGPDEWLVMVPEGEGVSAEQRLLNAAGDAFISTNIVSGGLLLLKVSGANARGLLAKGCTLDLHPDAFKVGQCAQSGIAKTSVLLAITAAKPEYSVLVRRTFAEYLALWMARAGKEYGIVFTA